MKKSFLAVSLITCTFSVTLANQAQAQLTTPTQPEPTPVTLFAAGSLTDSLTEVATDFTQEYGVPVNTVFGPSGGLRVRLENGEKADVFASADTGNPITLNQENLSGPVTTFTSNRLVAVARPGLSVTSNNILDELLNPQIKVGTSTPISDPAGDYAEEIFRKADQIQPGSFQTLDAKALRLVGGPSSPPVPNGESSLTYFLKDTQQADIFLTYYTSTASALKESPDLQVVELPANLAVQAPYGLTVLNNSSPNGAKLADYILSPTGQQILAKYGFTSPSTSVPEHQGTGGIALAAAIALLVNRKLASKKQQLKVPVHHASET